MASFYGAGVIVNGGNSGTSDYNHLSNTPIINLTGILPIDFSTLEPGAYNVQGNFAYKAGEETQTWHRSNLVRVTLDEVAQKKVVFYDVVENGVRVAKTITYSEDGSYSISTFNYELMAPPVADESELPTEGDVSKLYTTSEGIYVYTEEGYRKLGTSEPVWESL